jgi:hypothetical protein
MSFARSIVVVVVIAATAADVGCKIRIPADGALGSAGGSSVSRVRCHSEERDAFAEGFHDLSGTTDASRYFAGRIGR